MSAQGVMVVDISCDRISHHVYGRVQTSFHLSGAGRDARSESRGIGAHCSGFEPEQTEAVLNVVGVSGQFHTFLGILNLHACADVASLKQTSQVRLRVASGATQGHGIFKEFYRGGIRRVIMLRKAARTDTTHQHLARLGVRLAGIYAYAVGESEQSCAVKSGLTLLGD